MIKHFDDPYDLFIWYFQNGLDIKKTLRHFNIVNGTIPWSTISSRWNYYKTTYEDKYQQAKQDYFEFNKISEVNIINTLADIAFGLTEGSPTQIKALELLQKILSTSHDQRTLDAANRLVIEVIDNQVSSAKLEVSDESQSDL